MSTSPAREVLDQARCLYYSLQIEKAYVYWAKTLELWMVRSPDWLLHPNVA